MRIGAIICFVLSGLTALLAVNNVFFGGGENRPEGIENLAPYAVGAFMVPMALLIVGLILLKKAKKRDS